MASRINRPNGHKWIQFTGPDRRRQTLRLGKMSARDADSVKRRVELLLSARMVGSLPDPETAAWLTSIPRELRRRIEKLRLVTVQPDGTSERDGVTIAELADLGQKKPKPKSLTDTNERRYAAEHLVACFGASHKIEDITVGDAEDFYQWLQDGEEGAALAPSTAGKRCEKVKRYFASAVKRGWLEHNPFDEVTIRSSAPRDRDRTITTEMAMDILRETPDPRFRFVFACCRFGGMRQTEPLGIRWDGVNWEEGTITLWASKTKSWRTIPIFPEIRPLLDTLWEQAHDGEQFVLGRWNVSGSALTNRLKRVLRRLGVEPWPKPFHNLRATRQTELGDLYPAHVVNAWIGNTKDVAEKHYYRVTKEHIQSAQQPPAAGEVKPEALGVPAAATPPNRPAKAKQKAKRQ